MVTSLYKSLEYGFPKFTNEVQHLLYEVLQWDTDMDSSRWMSDVRLPVFKERGNRSGKSRQLWIARHRQWLVN
jgi:hypothetical protein